MTTLSELLRLQEELPGKQWAIDGDGRPGMEWNNFIVQAEARHMTVCFMAHSPEDNSKLEKAAEFIAAARNFDFGSLQMQYEAMREWLNRFAVHTAQCNHDRITQKNVDGRISGCTCGLSALRASLDTKARGDG